MLKEEMLNSAEYLDEILLKVVYPTYGSLA